MTWSCRGVRIGVAAGAVILLVGPLGCGANRTAARAEQAAPAVAKPIAAAQLDAEYAAAIGEWREEARWGEFFTAMIANKGPNALKLDHLGQKDWNALVDGMNGFAFDCTWPWLMLREAKMRGEEGAPATKRAFIDKWRKVGPELHERRVKLAIEVADKALKAENVPTMRLLEEEFGADGARLKGGE